MNKLPENKLMFAGVSLLVSFMAVLAILVIPSGVNTDGQIVPSMLEVWFFLLSAATFIATVILLVAHFADE